MTLIKTNIIRSLRNRLLLITLAGILLTSLLASGTGFLSSYHRAKDTQDQRLRYTSEMTARAIAHSIDESLRIAGRYSLNPAARELLFFFREGSLNRDSLNEIFTRQLTERIALDPEVVGIVRLDAAGKEIAAAGARYPKSTWPSLDPENRNPGIGDPLFLNPLQMRLVVSAPILDVARNRIGTDIVFFNGHRLLSQLRMHGEAFQAGSHTYIAASLAGRPLFIGENGIARLPEDVIGFTAKPIIASGALNLASGAYGYAPIGKNGWTVVVRSARVPYFVDFEHDLQIVLAAAALVSVLAISGIAFLFRPLAKGIVLHAETLETLVQERNLELNRQHELLEAILRNVPHGIFWKNAQGVYQGCSPTFAVYRGLETTDDVVGKTLEDFRRFIPDTDAAAMADRRVLMEGASLLNMEESTILPGGTTCDLLTSKVPLRDIDNRVIGVLGVFADITEQKRVQAALQESERRLSTLMNNLPGMAYRCRNDPSWTMEIVSGGAFRLTGYHPHELIGNAGKPFAKIIHPDDRKMVAKTIED